MISLAATTPVFRPTTPYAAGGVLASVTPATTLRMDSARVSLSGAGLEAAAASSNANGVDARKYDGISSGISGQHLPEGYPPKLAAALRQLFADPAISDQTKGNLFFSMVVKPIQDILNAPPGTTSPNDFRSPDFNADQFLHSYIDTFSTLGLTEERNALRKYCL